MNGNPEIAKKLYASFCKGVAPSLELTDEINEAVRFFFINRCSFSGISEAGGFSPRSSTHRFTKSAIERLFALPPLLSGVTVTNNDIFDIWDKFPANSYVYFDPPYGNASKLYGKNGELHSFDHARFARLLTESRDKFHFLVTYNAEMVEIFPSYKQFTVVPWNQQYAMNSFNSPSARVGKEVLIFNYASIA